MQRIRRQRKGLYCGRQLRTFAKVRLVIENSRRRDKHIRAHSKPGCQSPAHFAPPTILQPPWTNLPVARKCESVRKLGGPAVIRHDDEVAAPRKVGSADRLTKAGRELAVVADGFRHAGVQLPAACMARFPSIIKEPTSLRRRGHRGGAYGKIGVWLIEALGGFGYEPGMNSPERSSAMDFARYFVAGIMACFSTVAVAAAEERIVPVAVHRAEFAPAGGVAFEALTAGMPLGVGSRVKTGEGGWARLEWGRPGTLAFHIRGDLGVTEMRHAVAALPGAAFAPVDSALKATLTNNDARVVPPPSMADGVSLRLFSGELHALAERAAVQVKFVNGVLTSRAGRFAVSVEAAETTRITVDSGTVTLVVAGGRSFNVGSGQTVRIIGTGAALVVKEPEAADGVAGGRADVIALRTTQAGGLAPIAQGEDGKTMLPAIGQGKDLKEMLPPIGQGPGGPVGSGGVGRGLSAPFDLPGEQKKAALLPRGALLLPANRANIDPPVNSPERP